eukprot:1857598-Alexandrium_andersonii.AAC.1
MPLIVIACSGRLSCSLPPGLVPRPLSGGAGDDVPPTRLGDSADDAGDAPVVLYPSQRRRSSLRLRRVPDSPESDEGRG